MKLYYARSVCSLAVRIIIHELNLRCDYEAVDLKTKRTETGEAYLSINPKGAVPALRLDEGKQLLTENAVILQYLADKERAINLLPAVNDMQRYRVLEWLNFISTDLHRYTAPLFWAKIPADVKENLYKPILQNQLNYVEQHLLAKPYLMGEAMCLADPYLFVILIWLVKLKFSMTSWPNLKRYFATMKARPSVSKALAEEDLLEYQL